MILRLFRGERRPPKKMTIRRILVPTEFSAPSLKALDYAINFAGSQNAELLLIHVVEPIRHTRFIPDVSQLLEHRHTEVAEELAGLEKETRRRHRNCRSEVHFGIPYDVIANIARKWKADLIIIASNASRRRCEVASTSTQSSSV
jgi:nucleotide-binding universal stress UspA family protein